MRVRSICSPPNRGGRFRCTTPTALGPSSCRRPARRGSHPRRRPSGGEPPARVVASDPRNARRWSWLSAVAAGGVAARRTAAKAEGPMKSAQFSSIRTLLFAGFLMIAASPIAFGQTAVPLSTGWLMQDAAHVPQSGETISQVGFAPRIYAIKPVLTAAHGGRQSSNRHQDPGLGAVVQRSPRGWPRGLAGGPGKQSAQSLVEVDAGARPFLTRLVPRHGPRHGADHAGKQQPLSRADLRREQSSEPHSRESGPRFLLVSHRVCRAGELCGTTGLAEL